MKKRLLHALQSSLLLLALAAALPARAAATYYLPYQGYLTDQNGNPLGSTNTGPKNYNLVFRIWDLQSGGTTGGADELYAEEQTVTVNNGYFSVLLGAGFAYNGEPHTNNLPGLFNPANMAGRWVETSVQGISSAATWSTILPRLSLQWAPYAFQAVNAQNAQNVVNAAGISLLAVNGNALTLGTNATVAGSLSLGNTLTVVGPASLLGGASVSNSLTVTGNASVSGNASLLGGASVSNNLTVTGTASVSGPASLLGGASVSNNLTVAGNASVSSNLLVSGAVGIGTTNLSDNFEVNGSGGFSGLVDVDVKGTCSMPSSFSQITNAIRFGGNGSGQCIFSDCSSGSANQYGLSFGTAWATRMVIAQYGNVGIGTTTPSYPLDVESYSSVFVGPYEYMQETPNNGVFYTPGYSGAKVSIYTPNRMVAGEFDAISDARIKEIINRSNPENDLATVRKLQITDYRKVDKVQFGMRLEKGVIAQEVEKIVPEAVSTSTNFIPNIYSLPQRLVCTNQTLVVTMDKPHSLVVGDVVRLITDAGPKEVPVAAVVSPLVFSVPYDNAAPRQVFVYGKEVGDFRTVNYDRLFTTGLGAIQELAKRTDELETQKAQVAELQSQMAEMKTQFATQQAQLADLKKLVVQLAEATKNSKLTAGAGAESSATVATASVDR